MKRTIAFILLICLCLSAFSGCGAENNNVDDHVGANPGQQTTAAQETTEPAPVYEEGTELLLVRSKKSNNDGSGTYYTEYKYDEYGRLIEEIHTDTSGSTTGRDEYIYDENGFLVQEISYDEDDKKEYCYSYEYEDGYRVKESVTKDGELRWETTWKYTKGGYILEKKTEDSRGVKIYEYEYNEDYSERTEYYVNGDSRWVSSVAKLGLNNIEEMITTYKSNGKKSNVRMFEYGKYGLEKEKVYNNSQTSSDYDIIYTYDENGNLIKKEADYYYGSTYEYTYEPVTVKRRVN